MSHLAEVRQGNRLDSRLAELDRKIADACIAKSKATVLIWTLTAEKAFIEEELKCLE